jgi:hypothetical protein
VDRVLPTRAMTRMGLGLVDRRWMASAVELIPFLLKLAQLPIANWHII